MREVPDPLRVNYKGRLEETEMVLFSTVDELLASTGIKPHEVRWLQLPLLHVCGILYPIRSETRAGLTQTQHRRL